MGNVGFMQQAKGVRVLERGQDFVIFYYKNGDDRLSGEYEVYITHVDDDTDHMYRHGIEVPTSVAERIAPALIRTGVMKRYRL